MYQTGYKMGTGVGYQQSRLQNENPGRKSTKYLDAKTVKAKTAVKTDLRGAFRMGVCCCCIEKDLGRQGRMSPRGNAGNGG